MASTWARSFWALLPLFLLAASAPALPCSSSPPDPAQTDSVSIGDRWAGAGMEDLRARNYKCALEEFSRAVASFRSEMRARRTGQATSIPTTDPQVNLAFTLAQEGYVLSKLGQRQRAAASWREAAQISSPPSYARTETTLPADDLFRRHQFRASIQAYQNFIFGPQGVSRLSVGESENGAESVIRKGLALGLDGDYKAAFATLKASPPSQAASYLAGQFATLIGDKESAYQSYLSEIVANLALPAPPPGPLYGTVFDRPTWLRLANLAAKDQGANANRVKRTRLDPIARALHRIGVSR